MPIPSTVFHCWPTHWLKAAVEAGLAFDAGDHYLFHGGEEMRQRLEYFAEQVILGQPKEITHSDTSPGFID